MKTRKFLNAVVTTALLAVSLTACTPARSCAVPGSGWFGISWLWGETVPAGEQLDGAQCLPNGDWAPVISACTACEAKPADDGGTDTAPKTDGPVIDQFGVEGAFPGKVDGPAIAELYNKSTGYCAVVKVNSGETLNWTHTGAFWRSASQASLDSRWPHHLEEYGANYPKCSSVESAAGVK